MDEVQIVKTNRYQILTPRGFVDFMGIAKIDIPQTMVRVVTTTKVVRVTFSHEFINEFGSTVMVKDLMVGNVIQTDSGLEEVEGIEFDGEESVYEVLHVDAPEHVYYANGVLNHNCKFLGSQDTIIDSDVLDMIKPIDPVELKYGSLLKIFEEPISGEFYVLGVDVAGGIGKDYSTIQVLRVIDANDVAQVATYASNKIPPKEFGYIVNAISEYYEDAKMMVESNGFGEDLCMMLWNELENENLVNFHNIKLGIRAGGKSKMTAVLNMKRYIENRWVVINDVDTLGELGTFIERTKGKFEASGDKLHDDLVSALYWALYYLTTEQFRDDFGVDDDEEEGRRINDKYRLKRESDEDDAENDSRPTQFYFGD